MKLVLKAGLVALCLLPGIVCADDQGHDDHGQHGHVPDYSLPTGSSMIFGNAAFQQTNKTLKVEQFSDRLITEWQTFNIGTDATVTFIQPSAASIALNRVVSHDPSHILGHLLSNGQIFLVNPSGILFGSNAVVDVGGLVASTLAISNENFLNRTGNFFNAGSASSIENKGSIHAHLGGYLAFIAPQIVNKGTINAPNGTVAMGSGDRVLLDHTGDGLITLSVQTKTMNALIDNQELIKSHGGAIIMSARAAGILPTTTINNSGILEAKSLTRRDGKIVLDAGNIGTAQISGALNASSTSATGGNISVTGREVILTKTALLNANGYTGGGSIFVGGGWQGSNNIRKALLTTIEKGARLQADATHTGPGGTVVAWSNVKDAHSRTSIQGHLSARGAGTSHGGKIETAGYTLILSGSMIDTRNDVGQSGEWYIDPVHF